MRENHSIIIECSAVLTFSCAVTSAVVADAEAVRVDVTTLACTPASSVDAILAMDEFAFLRKRLRLFGTRHTRAMSIVLGK